MYDMPFVCMIGMRVKPNDNKNIALRYWNRPNMSQLWPIRLASMPKTLIDLQISRIEAHASPIAAQAITVEATNTEIDQVVPDFVSRVTLSTENKIAANVAVVQTDLTMDTFTAQVLQFRDDQAKTMAPVPRDSNPKTSRIHPILPSDQASPIFMCVPNCLCLTGTPDLLVIFYLERLPY